VFGPIKNENFARDFGRDMPALTDRRSGLCFIRNELSCRRTRGRHHYIYVYTIYIYIITPPPLISLLQTLDVNWLRRRWRVGHEPAFVFRIHIFYYFWGRLMAVSLVVQLNYSDNGFNYHFHTLRLGTGSLLYDSPKLLPAAEIYCSLK